MSVGQFVNGAIRSSFMGTFTSFLYFTFLCAGVLCAFISALIEYQVFTEFLKKVSSMGLLFSLIPLLCAISLETSKIFLTFYLKHSRQPTMEKMLENNKSTFFGLRALRIILIVISFACTLIFSFYNLHNPGYKDRLEEKKREIMTLHDEQVKQAENDFDNDMKISEKEVDWWNQKVLEESKNVVRGTSMGPKLEAAKEELEEARERHEKRRDKYETERSKKIQESRHNRDQELANVEQNLKNSREVQNKMLSAMLEVIYFSPNYPQEFYKFIILAISFLLTFALETIIIGSHGVLAMNHSDVFHNNLFLQTIGNVADQFDGSFRDK